MTVLTTMDGTAMYSSGGVATRLGNGAGWKVKSLIGNCYPVDRKSVMGRLHPNRMTNVLVVKTKAAARRELERLERNSRRNPQ